MLPNLLSWARSFYKMFVIYRMNQTVPGKNLAMEEAQLMLGARNSINLHPMSVFHANSGHNNPLGALWRTSLSLEVVVRSSPVGRRGSELVLIESFDLVKQPI